MPLPDQLRSALRALFCISIWYAVRAIAIMYSQPIGPSAVVSELRRRIQQRGSITFAEFMAAALYWPRGGYYATRNAFGPSGDFFTAPMTHPVFGALIVRQLHQMWSVMGRPSPFWVVEQGAGNGRLAADVGRHAPALSEAFAGALRYVTVDLRPGRPREAPEQVRSSGLPFRGLRGVILGNELLDAMPVHRVTVLDGQLRELYVDLADSGGQAGPPTLVRTELPAFREVVGELSTDAIEKRFADRGVALPEGYRTEVALEASRWIADAALSLDAGYVLLIDYGHEARDYYAPERSGGTLRCHYQHTVTSDPFVRVGRQDLGAHVEFTSVMRAASEAGFTLAGFVRQEEFLRNLGLAGYEEALRQRNDILPAVAAANLRAMRMLADPEGMGAFKALALRKGVPEVPLAGFGAVDHRLAPAEVPLATAAHMQLGVTAGPQAMPTWDELLR